MLKGWFKADIRISMKVIWEPLIRQLAKKSTKMVSCQWIKSGRHH